MAGTSLRTQVAYGLLGAPLAFGALPLYVALPHHYAQLPGVEVGALGAVLLATRGLDAVVDPLLGRWVDSLLRRSERHTWLVACLGCVLLAIGFTMLWRVPEGIAPLLWLLIVLPLCTLACTGLTIMHLAWGTRWQGAPVWRARIATSREASALFGVMLASALMSLPNGLLQSSALVIGLVAGMLGLRRTFELQGSTTAPAATSPKTASPWANPAFRRLATVHLINGMAAAIPATLLPFFVADRLQQPAMQGLFLLGYFGAAALATPWWLNMVARRGLAPTWRRGMVCTVIAFALTPLVSTGDTWWFMAICVTSGAALGADLAVPGALLTGLVQQSAQPHPPTGAEDQGLQPASAGLHAGWWAFVGKLSLALAAGLSLPLLQAWGYQLGSREPAALQALVLAYAGLPCILKLMAALTLWRGEQKHPTWRACT
ncbi:MAG: MFS transporter [Sphingomonas sp.]|nr:MAG: MFS transporter [Sphingomonas sp.]